MNDLPVSSASTAPSDPVNAGMPQSTQHDPSFSSAVSYGNKEASPASTMPDRMEGLADATGQELELPKEVVSAGVRVHPTTIKIPAPVSKLGVKPSGMNIPVQTTSTVVLPLTDDQIAKGLHEGINNSVRWLAEWCVKRLKHLHYTLKNVNGSLLRVKE